MTLYVSKAAAVTKDFVFGFSLYTVDDQGRNAWIPFNQLDRTTLESVLGLLSDPIFPPEAREAARSLLHTTLPGSK